MELLRQPVATGRNGFRLFLRFSALGVLRPIASGCNLRGFKTTVRRSSAAGDRVLGASADVAFLRLSRVLGRAAVARWAPAERVRQRHRVARAAAPAGRAWPTGEPTDVAAGRSGAPPRPGSPAPPPASTRARRNAADAAPLPPRA